MIIVTKYLIPKGYAGITLFPFIFLREEKLKQDAALINHEKIHLRQQAELLVVFFYIWYSAEYLIRLLQYRNHKQAYRNISFEREAYTNGDNPDYLQNRKSFLFAKYLNVKA